MITNTMGVHDVTLEPATGISIKNIYACLPLCAGGAMALLQRGCDPSVIKLMAHWYSDVMIWYLHQQMLPGFQNLLAKMFCNSRAYSFLPAEKWIPAATSTAPPSSDKYFSLFHPALFCSQHPVGQLVSWPSDRYFFCFWG